MLRTNPGTAFVRVVEQHAACLPSTAPAACSPVAHAPTRVRTALQPLLVAPALHLVQPQRLAHALPKGAARHGNAHGAQPQLRQRSTAATAAKAKQLAQRPWSLAGVTLSRRRQSQAAGS